MGLGFRGRESKLGSDALLGVVGLPASLPFSNPAKSVSVLRPVTVLPSDLTLTTEFRAGA